jgi:F420-dependent oxidoreductase-like protein
MTTFGFQIPGFTHAGETDDHMFDDVVEKARAAEAGGFSSVWVMDHFWQLPMLGGPEQPILEAYVLLGALAASTERVELGTLVTGVTYRNPALLAKMVTTLDVISKGRAVLGIGAAWYDPEHDGLGFDFPGVRERMDRLEEAVQICRAMFREDAPSFTGRYYRIEGARNVPRPLQPGGPPIMIGGGGERRTLRLVAQYADRCNVSGSAATVRHKLEVLRRHCADVGREPTEISSTRLGTLVVTPDADETARVSEFLRGLSGDGFAEQFTIGQDHEVVEQVAELVDAGVDECIFNLPMSDAATVQRAGEVLVGAFG